MQLIYALETAENSNGKTDPVKKLLQSLDQSRDLFFYLVYFLTETAAYAEKDAKLRASKNFITESDLNVNIKIAGNELLWKIKENPSFKKYKEDFIPFEDSSDFIKKTYQALVSNDVYNDYITEQGRNKNSEREIIKFIFTDLMLPDENFVSHIEDHFTNWDDDAEMINQLMMNFLQKPSSFSLTEMVGEEKWKFAKSLLLTAIEKKMHVSELIKPKLKNWDADRIASIDMILMQMGVCELLYFETIPPKVTINEYIDIAKDYSTPQSGHFVNGILDGIHKELLSQNKIHKIDFKQKT